MESKEFYIKSNYMCSRCEFENSGWIPEYNSMSPCHTCKYNNTERLDQFKIKKVL